MRVWLAGIAATTGSLVPAIAPAGEIAWGPVEGTFDTTVSVGATLRTEDPADSNVCSALGGSSPACGNTDGNLNYRQGRFTSTTIQATHELDLRWENLGLFTRLNYFYDSEVHDGSRRHLDLAGRSRKEAGADWQLLDGYVSATFAPMEMPLLVRVGEQVISWGESTFLPNGINVINPIDVNRLRSPGAELREALLPVPAAYFSLGVTENFSVEAFYQWGWRETRLDPAGTFFSTNDGLGPGGKSFDLSTGFNDCSTNPVAFGVFQVPGNPTPAARPSCLVRGADVKPKDGGQWGVAVRLFVPWLNSAEVGLYAIHYHSRLPYVGASFFENIVTAQGNVPRLFSNLRARVEYPENIRKYGASLSSTIESLDLAVQGELSWSKDFPLLISEQQGVRALLTGAGLPGNTPLPGVPVVASENTFISGAFDHRVYTGQMTLTKLVEPGPIVGDFLGASQLALVGEAGFIRVRGLPSTQRIAFQGAVTPQMAPAATSTLDADFGQKFSWGYVAVARLIYNNAFLGWNLSPGIAYSHDVNGTSPAPIGNFVEGRKALTVSMLGDYLNKWGVSLAYTSFFGAGKENVIRDRDFVSLSVQYSF